MYAGSEQLTSTGRRPVVVGYNGKPHGREALIWAAAEASRRDAPVLLVYAANYPGMTLDPGPGLLDPDPQALEAANEVTARGVAEALTVAPDLRVAGATEVTSPVQALTQAAAEAGLLVIGSRGHGPVLGALLGSVAFAVAARASCPVIVVKTKRGPRPASPGSGGPVVVGTDGSEGAAYAVRFAADHAAQTSRVLQIVTYTGDQPPTGISKDLLRETAQQIADATRDMVVQTHPELTVGTRVGDGPAEQPLIDASATADLVAVGTRGRGAFRGMLLGSVSHALIHGALCPIAVIGADSCAGATGTEPDVGDRAVSPGPHQAEMEPTPLDLVEIWGHGSFPASDPPANW